MEDEKLALEQKVSVHQKQLTEKQEE